MYSEPTFYAWFLHREMLDAMFDGSSRYPLGRALRRLRTRGDQIAYARELEAWLTRASIPGMGAALSSGTEPTGRLVTLEVPFVWSDVARERSLAMAGQDARSSFHARLVQARSEMEIRGTFNPARLTCSTANSELRGVRTQFMLAQVAAATPDCVELRPLAIATRVLG